MAVEAIKAMDLQQNIIPKSIEKAPEQGVAIKKPEAHKIDDAFKGEKSSAGLNEENGYDKGREEKASSRLFHIAVEHANKNGLKHSSLKLDFSVHDKTKKVMVKVIDNETKEVVREIPDEKALEAYAKMLELTGLLLDEQG